MKISALAIRRAMPRSRAMAFVLAAWLGPGAAGGTEDTTAEKAEAEPPVLEEETIALRIRRRPAQAGEEGSVEHIGPDVPLDSFIGEVTGIHQSVLDRQIIAVDHSYLFVSDQARQGRFKVGQSVDLRRQKSRFGAGRTWRITGSSKRTIGAARIRCERDDIGSDDRRRCERMLGE